MELGRKSREKCILSKLFLCIIISSKIRYEEEPQGRTDSRFILVLNKEVAQGTFEHQLFTSIHILDRYPILATSEPIVHSIVNHVGEEYDAVGWSGTDSTYFDDCSQHKVDDRAGRDNADLVNDWAEYICMQ